MTSCCSQASSSFRIRATTAFRASPPTELNAGATEAPNPGTTRAIDATSDDQNTTGSLSSSSSDNHAKGPCPKPCDCTSSVVLPKPGGAMTTPMGASGLASRSTNRGRDTSAERRAGGRSFASISTMLIRILRGSSRGRATQTTSPQWWFAMRRPAVDRRSLPPAMRWVQRPATDRCSPRAPRSTVPPPARAVAPRRLGASEPLRRIAVWSQPTEATSPHPD